VPGPEEEPFCDCQENAMKAAMVLAYHSPDENIALLESYFETHRWIYARGELARDRI
jgi:hypothetical protein